MYSTVMNNNNDKPAGNDVKNKREGIAEARKKEKRIGKGSDQWHGTSQRYVGNMGQEQVRGKG